MHSCSVDPLRRKQQFYVYVDRLHLLLMLLHALPHEKSQPHLECVFSTQWNKAASSAQPLNMDYSRISCWEAGLRLTIKTKGTSDRHDVCSFLQMLSQTLLFSLGSGTLTHSAFTAAGSLSAVFTHITGVKGGRFHNEVQRLMAAGIKMPSATRNHGPLWWPPLWDISAGLHTGWLVNEFTEVV